MLNAMQEFEAEENANTPTYMENAKHIASYTEYEVDALAHMTEEGRGDRRNVWGELHASDEPQDSE